MVKKMKNSAKNEKFKPNEKHSDQKNGLSKCSVMIGIDEFCTLYESKIALDLIKKLIFAEVAKNDCKFINIENVCEVLQNLCTS